MTNVDGTVTEGADSPSLDDRRRSYMAAKQSLEGALAEHSKNANEFAKAGAETIRNQGQNVQLASSKKWYNFWEKASTVPRNLKASGAGGVEQPWDKVTQEMLDAVRAAATEEASLWDNGGNKSGAQVEWSNTHLADKVPMVRVTKEVAVTPRTLLLSQVRAPLLGKTDPSLLYMREHYSYRGGRTTLFHQVKTYGTNSMVAMRDCALLQSWQENEDGSITIAARSMEGNIKEGVVKGAQRSAVLLYGMHIRPADVKVGGFFSKSTVKGCQVVCVSHKLLKGFLPNFLAKSYIVQEILTSLHNVETVSSALESSGELGELIERFVVHPDGPELDEAPEEAK